MSEFNTVLSSSNLFFMALILGVGATAIMDGWAYFLKIAFQVKGLDYGLVGRWIGHMTQGTFAHQMIGNSAPIKAEKPIGWIIHYAIGVIFAYALLMIWGIEWLAHPTVLPALIVGIATVIFPFFIMQPSFGLGIAGANLPEPNMARAKSLMAHASFGVGLYVSAWVISILQRMT